MKKTNLSYTKTVKSIVPINDSSISLRDAGVITFPYCAKERFGDIAFRRLYPHMRESYFNPMYEAISEIRREREPGIVYLMTNKTCNMCNALIANVHTLTESCIKTEVIYTDDKQFRIERLKPIYDEFMFNLISEGKHSYINRNNTYVFKVTSKLNGRTSNEERRVEYVVYLPDESLR